MDGGNQKEIKWRCQIYSNMAGLFNACLDFKSCEDCYVEYS